MTHALENVKLDTAGKQEDMKARYIIGPSLKQPILPERVQYMLKYALLILVLTI
jgi:hypothetical protein